MNFEHISESVEKFKCFIKFSINALVKILITIGRELGGDSDRGV